jgi:alanyl-tRNA synthetase
MEYRPLMTVSSTSQTWSFREEQFLLFGADGFLTDGVTAEKGACVSLVFDKTSFYAKAGGHESDLGAIAILSKVDETVGSFTVTDVHCKWRIHPSWWDSGKRTLRGWISL